MRGGLVVIDDIDEAFALVGAYGAFGHQQRIGVDGAAELHGDKHAWHEAAIFIGEAGTGANGAGACIDPVVAAVDRSEEHTSELQSLMRTPYAGFRLKKKNIKSLTIQH